MERGMRFGAGDGIRTRDIDLGKVALYQLSYSRLSETFIFYCNVPAVKHYGKPCLTRHGYHVKCMLHEYAFEMATSSIRFGPAPHAKSVQTWSISAQLTSLSSPTPPSQPSPRPQSPRIARRQHIRYTLFDRVRVEPSDTSLPEAIGSPSIDFDAIVAVGGGSIIDTAKAANLYACWPADFLDYVNPPIGKGNPSRPAETSHRDPNYRRNRQRNHRRRHLRLQTPARQNRHRSPQAQAHARHCRSRKHPHASRRRRRGIRPRRPLPRHRIMDRNSFTRAHARNVLSCVRPIRARIPSATSGARKRFALPRDTSAARSPIPPTTKPASAMLLASSYAGVGFGNAGVHLPHGMSYPVAGLVRDYQAPAMKTVDHALVPHGISVILNAPAVFRFTARASRSATSKPPNPRRRHSRANPTDAGEILAEQLIKIMQDLDMPNGLRALGYTSADIPALVEGTLPQHRVTKLSPRPARPNRRIR